MLCCRRRLDFGDFFSDGMNFGRKEKRVRKVDTFAPHNDGHQWRKYGEKKINNTNFPRSAHKLLLLLSLSVSVKIRICLDLQMIRARTFFTRVFFTRLI
jgi:hypothetical protein